MEEGCMITEAHIEKAVHQIAGRHYPWPVVQSMLGILAEFLQPLFSTMWEIRSHILRSLPVSFHHKEIPPEWIRICAYGNYVAIEFKTLWDSLPESERTDEVRKQLIITYLNECSVIAGYLNSDKGGNRQVTFSPFRQTGTQYLAEFSVIDRMKELTQQSNWHEQNTSQWVYAGCILVQNGQVSRHH